MLRVVNKNTYSTVVVGSSLFLICLLGGMYWWSGEDFVTYLVVAVSIEFLVLVQKFTYKIKIDDGKVEVTYYRLGFKRIKTFLLKDVVITIDEEQSENGRLNVLEIKAFNGKCLHKVFDEDGFDKDDFYDVITYERNQQKQDKPGNVI